jgi:GTPase
VRVTTGDLNRTIRAAMEATHPPLSGSRTPKVYYATQIGVHPPTIVLFTNGPELFDETYVRYLTKVLRDTFPFSEVAIKVVLRAKGEGIRRGFEDEPLDGAMAGDDDEETPIVRSPRRLSQPEPPVVEEPEQPRPRKKPRGSETWDF